LRVKLTRLAEWNRRRAQAAGFYIEQLKDIPTIILPEVPPEAEPVWHLFVMRHRKRDELQQALSSAGIDSLIHYPVPPHLSGAYADAGYREGSFPIAEELAKTVLSLPCGPHLTRSQALEVVSAIRQSAGTAEL